MEYGYADDGYRETYKLDISIAEHKEKWLELRHKDITSTEIGALFGVSPYHTARSLYAQKKLPNPPEFKSSERMQWGVALEPVIAEMGAKKLGLRIEPFNEYIRIPDLMIGSSFDYYYFDENGVRIGIVEVKNVDVHVFNSWRRDDDGNVVLPLNIQAQVQHQMLCSGLKEAVVLVLVGGNKLHTFEMKADTFGDAIASVVETFFDCIDFPEEFKIDTYFHPTDKERLADLPEPIEGKTKTVEDDKDLETVRTFLEKRDELNALKSIVDTLKLQVFEIFEDVTVLETPFAKLRVSVTKPNEGTLITQEDVGKRTGARKGSRRITISDWNNTA